LVPDHAGTQEDVNALPPTRPRQTHAGRHTDTSPESASANDGKKENLASNSVPFEITVGDERFQLQAQFIKELSPLDRCHHQVSNCFFLYLCHQLFY
jgi:hypothetical protein